MATEEELRRGVAQARENATVNVALTSVEQPKFTNLKLQKDVILNNFIFNTIDDYGVVWVITDIEGWWNSPSPEVPDIPRGYGDGSYDVQGRYLARTLTLSGVFLTPDPSMVQAARDRITEAVDLVYKGAWLLTGSYPIRASFVRSVDQPIFNTVNARGRTEFEIPLRAPDPIKYSWNDTQPDGYDLVELSCANYSIPGSGTGVVTNVGNYRVPCILEISGPIVGPSTVYNKTTDELLIVVESFGGSLSARVDNKQLSFNNENLLDIATLTTRTPHGFKVGSDVYIAGVGDPFDGNYTVESVPTETTFTYARLPEVSLIRPVAFKALQSGIAKLDTLTNHGFSVGQSVLVSGVDIVFDGTHVIASIPTPSSFTFTASRVPVSILTGKKLVSNIATLTTSAPHGFLVGEEVTVEGVDATNFNGTFVISSVSTDGLQFSYPRSRTDSKSVSNSSMTARKATITTAEPHGFIVGEQAAISSVSPSYDGVYDITSTPTSTTFTYNRPRSTAVSVVAKAAFGNTATLTTATPHSIYAGDQITVEGVDSTFDGTYTVTSVPSTTSLTYSKTAEVASTTVINGSVSVNGRWVIRAQLVGNVATLTTSADHGILVGESVTVDKLNATFNGTYTVTQATNNTFSYVKTGANIADGSTAFKITKIIRVSSTAVTTLTAAQATLAQKEQAVVTAEKNAQTNIDNLGKAVKTAETLEGEAESALKAAQDALDKAIGNNRGPNTIARLTAARNAAQTAYNAAKGVTEDAKDALEAAVELGIDGVPAVITAKAERDAAITAVGTAQATVNTTTSSTATATTDVPHGFATGDFVIVGAIFDETFNGYHLVTVGSPTQFSFTTTSTKPVYEDGEDEILPVEAGEGAYALRSTVTYSGNIASAVVSNGIVEVAGSLPFSATSGTATVSDDISRTVSNTGVAVKKNEIQFTPGVENGVAAIEADTLEINTQDREVAFNGELIGARAKIDVLADFIKLAPGDNIIEFKDSGNPESGASLKVFYRSGWLS